MTVKPPKPIIVTGHGFQASSRRCSSAGSAVGVSAGFENFTTAGGRQQKAAMFICGDDDEAKRVAAELAADLGFVPEDVGPLANAKPLEGMVKIWLALAARHGRNVGFAITEG